MRREPSHAVLARAAALFALLGIILWRVRLSRNFGHQIALTAGVDMASGEAVIVMDADLQDPPEVIPELVAVWREGYDMAYAQRRRREGETWLKKATADGLPGASGVKGWARITPCPSPETRPPTPTV